MEMVDEMVQPLLAIIDKMPDSNLKSELEFEVMFGIAPKARKAIHSKATRHEPRPLIRPARDYRALNRRRRNQRLRAIGTVLLEALGILVVLACLVGTYILLAA